ncbi:TetR/AcrR family transcriptional regulator [Nakamurella lactea]|uniref:TetR/AcrR family transcriptional regulator n=1 Tax=Nakamurella lactea TaxID=459515 RepID=UPI0013768F89|nr:TetR/AcrR family transcriptional regulator [Nakamurella lactea]
MSRGNRWIADVAPGDEGFPFPPWQARRPQPRPRNQLSRERIVEVALGIIDAEGTEAVSMRRIAAELGTGAASLYAYVASKEEVLTMVHESVMADLEVPQMHGDDWQDVIRTWAMQVYRTYAQHQDLARLSFAEIPSGPRMLDITERLLDAMITGGVPPQIASWLIDRLALYIGADAFEGWLMSKKFAAAAGSDGRSTYEHGQDWIAGIREYFAGLPHERYPNLIDHVAVMTNGGSDERFEFGLELMIEGVAGMSARRSADG